MALKNAYTLKTNMGIVHFLVERVNTLILTSATLILTLIALVLRSLDFNSTSAALVLTVIAFILRSDTLMLTSLDLALKSADLRTRSDTPKLKSEHSAFRLETVGLWSKTCVLRALALLPLFCKVKYKQKSRPQLRERLSFYN